MWPAVDRELRARLLTELRRRQTIEQSSLTPARRIAQADELLELAATIKGLGRGRSLPDSDEPPELWLLMLAHFKAADPEAELASPLQDAISRLAGFVAAWPRPAVIVGGIGIIARVRPRLTRDIDLLIAVAPEDTPALLATARQHGYDYDQEETRTFIEGGLVRLWAPPSRQDGVGLDLLFIDSPFLEGVVARATPLEIAGAALLVASVEDLLLMKLEAFRPSDLDDIIAIKDAFGAEIDLDYVRAQAALLDLSGRLEVFYGPDKPPR